MQDPALLIKRATAELTQLGLEVVAVEPPEDGQVPAANTWLRAGNAGALVTYAVEARTRLTPATHSVVTMQLQQVAAITGHPVLLVTDYLTPPMAQKLREQKQQFADAAGNVYLEGPGLLVFVTGRKPPNDQLVPHAGKAQTMTGLKVMFALLCDPLLADAPQRAIAARAGVALGALPAVLADLQQTGELLVLGKRGSMPPGVCWTNGRWHMPVACGPKPCRRFTPSRTFTPGRNGSLMNPHCGGASQLQICWCSTCAPACSRSMPTSFPLRSRPGTR